jgi:hypothetical protein
MSWKISPRSASSCRRQAHGDFQSFVRCQTRRAFCLEMDRIHCHRPLADRWKILGHLGSRCILGSGLAETSMRFLNRRASLARTIDLADRKVGMPAQHDELDSKPQSMKDLTFQHTDLSPSWQGLGPSESLTACRRSAPNALSGIKICQRFLIDCQLGPLEFSLAHLPSILKGPHGETEYSALSESGRRQMCRS